MKQVEYSGSLVMNCGGNNFPNQHAPGRNCSVTQLPIDPYFLHIQQGEGVTDSSFYSLDSYRPISQAFRGSSVYGGSPVLHDPHQAPPIPWNPGNSIEWYPNQNYSGHGASEWGAESWNNSPPVRNHDWLPEEVGFVNQGNAATESCCTQVPGSEPLNENQNSNLSQLSNDLVYNRNVLDDFAYNTKLDFQGGNNQEGIFPFEDSIQPQDIFALEQPYDVKRDLLPVPHDNSLSSLGLRTGGVDEKNTTLNNVHDSTSQRFLQSIDAIFGEYILDETCVIQGNNNPTANLFECVKEEKELDEMVFSRRYENFTGYYSTSTNNNNLARETINNNNTNISNNNNDTNVNNNNSVREEKSESVSAPIDKSVKDSQSEKRSSSQPLSHSSSMKTFEEEPDKKTVINQLNVQITHYTSHHHHHHLANFHSKESSTPFQQPVDVEEQKTPLKPPPFLEFNKPQMPASDEGSHHLGGSTMCTDYSSNYGNELNKMPSTLQYHSANRLPPSCDVTDFTSPISLSENQSAFTYQINEANLTNEEGESERKRLLPCPSSAPSSSNSSHPCSPTLS